MRRPRTCLASTDREAPGFRPGPLRRSATGVAGRGQAAARNRRQATAPEERTRVLRRRGGAPGGVAVCLYLPAVREIRRGFVPMRLSALRLPSSRGGKLKAQLAWATRERGRVAV